MRHVFLEMQYTRINMKYVPKTQHNTVLNIYESVPQKHSTYELHIITYFIILKKIS